MRETATNCCDQGIRAQVQVEGEFYCTYVMFKLQLSYKEEHRKLILVRTSIETRNRCDAKINV